MIFVSLVTDSKMASTVHFLCAQLAINMFFEDEIECEDIPMCDRLPIVQPYQAVGYQISRETHFGFRAWHSWEPMGVTLNGGKRYTQIIDRSFHLSMAALEAGTVVRSGDDKYVSVMIQYEKAEFLLCTLVHGRLYQQSLDLNFTEGEEVTFFLNGTGVVHMTGFLIEEQMENLEDNFTDSELDSDEAPQLLDSESKDSAKIKASKRKSSSNTSIQKKLKLDDLSDDSFMEDEAQAMKEYLEQDDSGDSDSYDDEKEMMDDDIFDDDDDDDDSSEEEQEVVKTPKGKIPVTPSKSDKKLKQSPSTEKKSSKTSLNDESSKKDKTEKKTPNKNLNVSENGEPKTPETESTKKKKKKKKKKKNSLTSEEVEQKTPSEKTTPKKQVLSGGTIMEEIKIGHGPEAKSGKMVHVYYAGKLSNNGKQFDSKLQGAPFKFRLGKREVISGWDSGLVGMKVGGKRRLTVPPSQGYGNSRQGPIPPGSTLVFEIELKAVS